MSVLNGPGEGTWAAFAEKVAAERDSLREQLEAERMRLVACGVVAMSDTPESAAKSREMHPEYRSASLGDVERTVDQLMALRERLGDAERVMRMSCRHPDASDSACDCCQYRFNALAVFDAKWGKR